MEERAATQGLTSTSALVKTDTRASTVNELNMPVYPTHVQMEGRARRPARGTNVTVQSAGVAHPVKSMWTTVHLTSANMEAHVKIWSMALNVPALLTGLAKHVKLMPMNVRTSHV